MYNFARVHVLVAANGAVQALRNRRLNDSLLFKQYFMEVHTLDAQQNKPKPRPFTPLLDHDYKLIHVGVGREQA
jgi:hypothetical protein